MSRCVAEFNRLAVDGFGGDCKARIYEADNGFVVSFYEGKEYIGAGAPCVTYGGAVLVAVQWLDNSDSYM